MFGRKFLILKYARNNPLHPKSHVLTHQNKAVSMSYTSSAYLPPISCLPGQTMGLPVWGSKFLGNFVTKDLFHFSLRLRPQGMDAGEGKLAIVKELLWSIRGKRMGSVMESLAK